MFITGFITGILYLASSAWLVFNLLNAKIVQDEPNKRILSIAFLALILHIIVLFSETITSDGLNPSFVNSFSLVSWLVVLLY